MSKQFVLWCAVGLAASGTVTNADPVFVSGYTGAISNQAGRTVGRNFLGDNSDWELGIDNHGDTLAGAWGTGQSVFSADTVYAFTIYFDGVDYLEYSINGVTLSTNSVDKEGLAINALQMTVRDRDSNGGAAGSYLFLSDLQLDGTSILESGDGGDGIFGTDNAYRDWELRDATLDDGFTITGNLNLVGDAFGDGDRSAFYMRFGNDQNFQVVPLPSVAGMAGVGLIGLVSRRRRV